MSELGIHVDHLHTPHIWGQGQFIGGTKLSREEMNGIVETMYHDGQVSHSHFTHAPDHYITVSGLRKDHPHEMLHMELGHMPSRMDEFPGFEKHMAEHHALEHLRETVFESELPEGVFRKSKISRDEAVDHFHHFLREHTGREIGREDAVDFLNTLYSRAHEEHYAHMVDAAKHAAAGSPHETPSSPRPAEGAHAPAVNGNHAPPSHGEHHGAA